MYTNTRQTGTNIAPVDVCKVPVVTPPFGIIVPTPTPFPNIAMRMQAVPAYFKVMIMNFPILNMASTVPVTSGDEVGALGGVTSQTIKGPASFTAGSTSVFNGGPGVTRQVDPTIHNAGNAPGGTGTDPSQTIQTVMI